MSEEKPLGFRAPVAQRITNEQLAERIGKVETKQEQQGLVIAEMKGAIDTLLEFAIEDRKGKSIAVQEQGKTERVRLGARAKILTVLLTTLGGVIGAGIAAAASGCL